MEAERRYALVDGLVLHAAPRPGEMTPDRMADVIRYHLDTLAYPAPRSTAKTHTGPPGYGAPGGGPQARSARWPGSRRSAVRLTTSW